MSEEFARNVLKVAMAQICQNLGWHAVQTSPMNILVDILQRYMSNLAKVTHQYAEHYNRIEPNLNDLALAFKELGISLTDLEDYANNVESVPFVHPIPKFPASHPSQFNFPKENCREVNLRPEWIFPHLPCVYPDEDPPPSPIETTKELTDSAFLNTDIPFPSDSPKPGTRRPFELIQDGNFPPSKRPRVLSDEEGRTREVVSVSMTPAGLISPYREGRLPDTCTPLKGFEDSRPSSPVISEEAEESLPPTSVAVVEPPPVLPVILPPEVIKVKKPKLKDGTKHKIKIKKENREKKKESKENKSKKKEMLKAQLKVKDKLTKLAKTKKLKNYKLPKPPKGVLDLSKHKKLGRPKKLKTVLPISKVITETVHKSDVPTVKPKVAKPVKHVTKSPKPSKVGKSPKSEKIFAGGQLASLLAKASGSANIKTEKFAPEKSVNESESYSRPESFSRKSASPVHYNEPRMVEHTSVPSGFSRDYMSDYEHHDHINSNSSSNLRSDSEEIPSFRSKVKLEPKDVYDFTDDEDVRNNGASDESRERDRERKVETATTPIPARVEPVISQVPAEIFRPMLTSPPKKKRGRPPKNPKAEPNLTPNSKSRTPEPFPRSPTMPPQQKSPFSSVSNFGMSPMSSQMPSMASHMGYFPLANIPPALLPFSFPSGVNQPNMNMDLPVAGPSGITQYPKLVDLADVAISKAQHDGDFDLGRIKDKDKAKREKKVKRDKKDKEKQKLKKKKDKTKEKNPEKSSSGKSDKNKDKLKSKKLKSSSESKNKDKKDKGEKTKDKSEKNKDKKKEKFKDKDKDKRLEKKKEKIPKIEKEFKEERERQRSPSPAPGVVFPRLTFKLGSGTESESPKIVIKGLSNTDSPSSSPLPYVSDRSPPGSPPHPRSAFGAVISGGSTSHGKAHVRPTLKVPVPPPPPPARTVITETVGTIIDASGNKIWICPACTHPDDGSPMIGCDDCDEWYHWICVGIVVPPNDDENWFCSRCISKQQTILKKRRYRKDN